MAKDKKTSFDIQQVRDLMVAMNDHDVSILELKNEGLELKISKSDCKSYNFVPSPAMSTSFDVDHRRQEEQILGTPVVKGTTNSVDDELGEWVLSPMVGTFYNSPGPDDPPFIKEGDTVTKDTVICIIEAMKVMNEVKAGVNGRVKKILTEDGQSVEFASKIILIET
jgi:acetyl-CoA carboxylase biotin carboxyl carrier protein